MREKYSVYLALATGCLIFLVTTLFALLQSPEILTASVRGGIAMSHSVAGREKCDNCHGSDGIKPYPVRHLGWSNGSCTRCHFSPDMAAASSKAPVSASNAKAASEDKPESPSPLSSDGSKPAVRQKASPIPHPVKGRETCSICHDSGKGFMPAPPDHAGWQNKSCEGCHICGSGEDK